MFLSRKKRVQNYLDSIEKKQWSPFDFLLDHYLSGRLLSTLSEYGVTKLSCHIDFLDDYMCINILGKHQSYYIDLQIEQKEFSIGCDPLEPDDHKCFPLESPEFFYSAVKNEIQSLNPF